MVRSWRLAAARHSLLILSTKNTTAAVSRYRNAQNTNKIGCKLVELGRATGLVAFTLFGYDVSFEAAHNADRLRIFKSTAWYALTDPEVDEIFQHSESDVNRYIKGIITAGIRLWKYEAAEEVT